MKIPPTRPKKYSLILVKTRGTKSMITEVGKGAVTDTSD